MGNGDGEYLTIKQAAALLGVSEKTLRRWDRAGKLSPVRHPINRYRVYTRSALAQLAPAAAFTATVGTHARPIVRSNVRPHPTSFVGRARELDALDALFAGSERMVTVLGPAGIGKTRVALRHAERALEREPSRAVWFCDLTEAQTLGDLAAQVAAAIGARLGPGTTARDAVEQLGALLVSRGETLLILDNAEQLAAACAEATARWLEQAPKLRLLVTSRERLRIRGEALFDLPPMAMPPVASRDGRDLGAYESVQLFEARALALHGHATGAPAWSEADRRAIGAIVRQLDGIPLAIELAAARARLLGPAGLLARLARPLDEALGDPRRDVSARQATLAGAIEWSWNLLAPSERDALGQCAVFRGGFSLDAAERVVDLASHGAVSVLAALESLCDRSLLRVSEAEGVPGERRFGMYLAIREYAEKQLATGAGHAAAYERHAEYVLARGQALADATVGHDGAQARRRLALEHDNLAAVHARAVAHAAREPDARHTERAIRAALVLDALLFSQGSFEALFALFDAALRTAGSERATPSLLARALEARGRLHRLAGRTDAALADLTRAVELARRSDDARAEGLALRSLCLLHIQKGAHADARAAAERALERFTTAGDTRLHAVTLACLGELGLREGKLAEATEQLGRARALLHEAGDRWFEGIVLITLGSLHQERAELDDARGCYERALVALNELGDRREGVILGCLAGILHEQGRLDEARPLYLRALDALRAAGLRHSEGLFRAALGAVDAELGHRGDARLSFDEAEVLIRASGDPTLLLALRVHRLQLPLLELRVALGTAAVLDGVRDDLAALIASNDDARSEDVRFAVRVLERALRDVASPRLPALALGPEGRWFRAPGAPDNVDLARRPVLRRLLAALADARDATPGVPVASEQLLAAAWPGERVIADAGAHRVRVAIATLRKLGLRSAIVHDEGGYLVDPGVRIERA